MQIQMNSTALPSTLDEVALPQKLPPLVLVAFTRPELLQEVLKGIQTQSLLPQQIIAFVDGARKPADQGLIDQCVQLLQAFSHCVPVKVIARSQNLGCDRNVISALTEVLATEESLIYLEDDTVPAPHFFDRMCRLLVAYRNQPDIFSVSAYANLPDGMDSLAQQDLMVSNRFFALGWGLWADRWQSIGLIDRPPAFNPFGQFHHIPATVQTKLTLVNQFWLEKNGHTDWVITTTLAALDRGMRHVITTQSMVRNIGFDHPEAKTYRGKEPAWVNARYNPDYRPNRLQIGTTLPAALAQPLSGVELAQYLLHQGLWLSPRALLSFWQRYPDRPSRLAFGRLFVKRLLVMVRRLRQGRPV